jgi:uncharacterized protein YkwD
MKKVLLLFLFFTTFTPITFADECQKCFEAINQFRTQSRCSELKWSDEIAADCQAWAEKLQSLGAIRYRGGLFRKGAGIHGYAGENCAQSDSGLSAFGQWFDSTSGHHEFMKRSDTTVGAVGRAGRYWVFRAEKNIETYRLKTSKQK